MAGPACGTDVTRAVLARSAQKGAKKPGENQQAEIVMVSFTFPWELFSLLLFTDLKGNDVSRINRLPYRVSGHLLIC